MTTISGPRTLHRLIYASRQCIAPEDLDREIAAIIRVSIQNNRAVSVTGLLLVHDGWFLQALEGPALAVMSTYGRIVDDRRHEAAKMISAGPVERRQFGDWNMCARGMGSAGSAIVRTLSQRGAFEPTRFTPHGALKLLTAVGGIQSRTEATAMI